MRTPSFSRAGVFDITVWVKGVLTAINGLVKTTGPHDYFFSGHPCSVYPVYFAARFHASKCLQHCDGRESIVFFGFFSSRLSSPAPTIDKLCPRKFALAIYATTKCGHSVLDLHKFNTLSPHHAQCAHLGFWAHHVPAWYR